MAGGTVVTLHGQGFDAFGAVPRALAWADDGGRSASHRLVARCRFGGISVPVIDMTANRAVCATPPYDPTTLQQLAAADNGGSAAAFLGVPVSLSLNGMIQVHAFVHQKSVLRLSLSNPSCLHVEPVVRGLNILASRLF